MSANENRPSLLVRASCAAAACEVSRTSAWATALPWGSQRRPESVAAAADATSSTTEPRPRASQDMRARSNNCTLVILSSSATVFKYVLRRRFGCILMKYKHMTDLCRIGVAISGDRSEEHTSELQSPCNLACRLLLEKKTHTPPARPRATSRIGHDPLRVTYRTR